MRPIVRPLSLVSKRFPTSSLTRCLYSTSTQTEGEEARVVRVVEREQSTETPKLITLTKNANLFPKSYNTERSFPGYIQPHHYKLRESELVSEFSKQLEKIASPILGVEPPIISLQMGTKRLKFAILKEAISFFGREIPSADIAKLRTVQDVAVFFARQVLSEVPPPEFFVPENVSLFIKEHSKKREILVREQMVKMMGERKRKAVEKQFKSYFSGPKPTLTEQEVEFYLKVFRRNADDQIFKSKLIKRQNPRKLYDTRIDYDRPSTSESETVFKRVAEQA